MYISVYSILCLVGEGGASTVVMCTYGELVVVECEGKILFLCREETEDKILL